MLGACVDQEGPGVTPAMTSRPLRVRIQSEALGPVMRLTELGCPEPNHLHCGRPAAPSKTDVLQVSDLAHPEGGYQDSATFSSPHS